MATNTDINASGSSDTNALTQGSNSQYGLGAGLPSAPSVQSTVTPQAASAATAPPSSSAPSSTAPAAPGSTPGSVPSLIPGWDTAGTAGSSQVQNTAAVAPAASGTGAPAAAATGDSSFDWSSILSNLGSFLTGPGGSALALLGLGEYEASQAESQTAALTSQLTGPSTPFVQAGTSELGDAMQGLTGAPVTGGSIGQQEQAAKELGDVATQYGTGQLTSAQQLQVQETVAAQKQAAATALASAGVHDSAVLQAYNTQADNNAAILTQQLTQQNLATAQTALASVQQTYSTLLNQATSTFAAGMGPIEDAVNITIQQDTAIANGLQSLFGNVAKALTSSGGAGGSSIGSLLGTLGSAIGKALGLTSPSVAGGVPSAASAAASDSTAATTGLGDISQWGADGSAANATWGGVAADANAGGPGASSTPGASPATWGGVAADAAAGTGLGAAGAAGTVGVTTDAEALAAPGFSSIGGAGAAAAGGGGAGDAASAVGGGANSLGLAAGALGAAAGAYDLATNWQSGATGTDALGGAETGAGIGTMIMPGIGTAVGALIGGAAGAISSVFGGGTVDPETRDVQNVINAVGNGNNNPAIAATAQNPYLMMAGLFDRHDSTLPIYAKYGRMGEQAFTQDLTKQINSAISSGKITAQTPADQVYNQVVAPWMQSMGNWDSTGATYKATVQGLTYDMVSQYMSGNAANNWKAVGGDSPFANIYAGSSIAPQPAPSTPGPSGHSAAGSGYRTQQQ